ncbi:molybdopterin oxidoreductase [Denitrovibrio acetiphilus DSM 12809]|uniref:Molybdopterin oxidoreductase n=1 Tax=Denitrovibrio acetiphilus (strain DSM 12809 / NBRC 114555 / N2460) TaxID=522772 RepID=D4H224_DENA2|nr:molybdopterin-dependent oxidoreductase [Denitrovibrio acetiphilus]ADD67001.1 molybdopterin oxidoreductase [Denitrovibrio acetiphilus DSM 12809]
MSLKDKLLKSQEVTRRTFLKGASAAGAAAALYGCGGGGGGKTYMEEDDTLEVPEIKEEAVISSIPNDCGGGCITKYYVADGVIKRIVTDEREDLAIDKGDRPQLRACVRCRSRKQSFYRNDRVMYPLKQTGERGDLNGFVRISWDQAYTEIAAKMEEIKSNYGAGSYHKIHAAGDFSGWSWYGINKLLVLHNEGYTNHWGTYSVPSVAYIASMIEGGSHYVPMANTRQDVLNAEHLVLWSYNPMETIYDTNTGWYLTQCKEKGIPVTVIDTRYSKTAATIGGDYVNIMPSTDAALISAMIYHILKNHFDKVDVDFINDYMYGFFDNGNSLYHSDVDASAYAVPDGGSLSAFIMGDEDDLTKATADHPVLNNATSIYPNTIGYNVNDDDVLHGKTVHIWGQKAKTPEWAEKITGVPADKIRELAEMYLTKKVTTHVGLGYQRHTESEQAVWLHRVLSVITKNFGAEGRSLGMINAAKTGAASPAPADLYVPNTVGISGIYDEDRTTSPSYMPAAEKINVPAFAVPDGFDNAGTSKSKWNDGQVKNLPESFGKAVFVSGANIMTNNSGDVNYNWDIYKDKSKCELIVNFEPFMTSTAAMSDYILPSKMIGEKPTFITGWFGLDTLIRSNVVTDAPGEVLDEYTICAGIAEKLGLKGDYQGDYEVGEEGMEARLRKGWDDADLTSVYGMTYDEICEKGAAEMPDTDVLPINYKDFRDDPANNPLKSPTGKFEAYCLGVIEGYEARYHENIDTVTSDDDSGVYTLPNGGSIFSKYHGDNTGRRFVYPIPMYIPAVEGRHAIDTTDPDHELAHDDPAGADGNGYKFTLHNWHSMYRTHSTHNNVAYAAENYKRNASGNPAFLDPKRDWTEGVWEDGIYEPVWINPVDANELGIQDGDRVLLSNARGKAYASARVTNRVAHRIAYMSEGGWFSKNSEGIDVGGCTNTLMTARPSRICKGMTSGNDCRIKIEKA